MSTNHTLSDWSGEETALGLQKLSRVIGCGFVSMLALALPASAVSTDERAKFRTSAQVYSAKDEDGLLWFSTWDLSSRYVVDGYTPQQSQDLERVLMTAVDAGRSVDIVYDASGGRWNEKAGLIEYPLCTVSIDELTFSSPRQCPERNRVELGEVARLALGHAEATNGSPQVARNLLDPIIAAKSGSAAFRKVALQSRATALEALADRAPEGSRSADAALVLALADLRTIAAGASDDVEAQLDVANVLRDLGDYASAEAAFRKVIARWPEQEERVAVSLALVARTKGDAQASLDILNDLVARHGPQDGMRFNYHRGWSLMKLGRFDEAVAALNEGIKGQPDYSWAYIHRACAYASTGRLQLALDDIETGLALFEKLPIPEITPGIRQDLNRLAEVKVLLGKFVAAGERQPKPELCTGYSETGVNARARSPLLTEKPDVLLKEIVSLE